MLLAAVLVSVMTPTTCETHKAADQVSPAREPPATAPAEDIDGLKERLAKTQRELDGARAKLAKTNAELSQTAAKLATAEEKLAQTAQPPTHVVELAELKAEHEAAVAKMRGRIAELDETAGLQENQINELLANLEAVGGQLDSEKAKRGELEAELAKADERLQRAQARQAAAGKELARQQKMHSETLAALEQARAELAGLKAQLAVMVDDFQRIYLATTAMGAPGLAGRQRAARGARIITRCATLRPSASQASTQRLLASIEVVFTQLDILEPYDASAAGALARLVQKSELSRRIDAALADSDTGPQVRALLFEAKLILTGAEGAS
jgi:peptidoglycan hydrolase CwlO-like protein